MFYLVFYLFMPFFNLYYLIYNREIQKTVILYNIAMGIISVSLIVDIIDSTKNYNRLKILENSV
jgi:hypothetical protein